MLRFTTRQRQALGGTLRELANLAAAALVFGQFVTMFWFAAVWLGLLIEGE